MRGAAPGKNCVDCHGTARSHCRRAEETCSAADIRWDLRELHLKSAGKALIAFERIMDPFECCRFPTCPIHEIKAMPVISWRACESRPPHNTALWVSLGLLWAGRAMGSARTDRATVLEAAARAERTGD